MNSLFLNHGFAALYQNRHAEDEDDILWAYPSNAKFVENAKAVIVHSHHARALASEWLGTEEAERWSVIPLLKKLPPDTDNRAQARHRLGFAEDDIVFCSFGLLGPMKSNLELLRGWLASEIARNPKAKLVFVGKNSDDDYGAQFKDAIEGSPLSDQISITGWVDNADFHGYLAACDIAVQLRTLSRGETSAAVLDCMSYGIPTIVNANGSMSELPEGSVYALPDAFTLNALTAAIDTLYGDAQLRAAMSGRALQVITDLHAPLACAQSYHAAIEKAYKVPSLIDALVERCQGLSLHELGLVAPVVRMATVRPVSRTLYVDISVLVIVDAKSGIQRVVRSILLALMQTYMPVLRIEPIYYAPERGSYLSAMEFTRKFLDLPEQIMGDDVIEFQRGDIFLGLDLCQNAVGHAASKLKKLRNLGVELHFIIYDLLPLTLPAFFPDGASEDHAIWLSIVAQMDSAICISRAVADEMPKQLDDLGIALERPLAINWFHLGADIENSKPTRGMPPESAAVLARLAARPSFLMVGTIEPRKGQSEILGACEKLWSSGADVNLVIVGKEGWKVAALIKKMREHPEWGKRLFWLHDVSDEYLDQIYAACTCMVAGSHGEGFGLPLIEAAKHGLPIVARDIPVFREVLKSDGVYFSESATQLEIAEALKAFLATEAKTAVDVDNLSVPTWQESTQALLACILEKRDPYLSWKQQVPSETY